MTEVSNVSRHPELLAGIAREIPNTIRLVTSPYSISRYTCLLHVFGFVEKSEYVEIARRGFNVGYASPDFAHWLMDKGFLTEIKPQDVRSGGLVFYSMSMADSSTRESWSPRSECYRSGERVIFSSTC